MLCSYFPTGRGWSVEFKSLTFLVLEAVLKSHVPRRSITEELCRIITEVPVYSFIITDISPQYHSSHTSPNVTTAATGPRSTVLCASQESVPV